MEEQISPINQEINNQRKSYLWIWLMIILFLIVLGVVSYFLLSRDRQDSTKSNINLIQSNSPNKSANISEVNHTERIKNISFLIEKDIGDLRYFDTDVNPDAQNNCLFIKVGGPCEFYGVDYRLVDYNRESQDIIGENFVAAVEVHSNLSKELFISEIEKTFQGKLKKIDFGEQDYYSLTIEQSNGNASQIIWYNQNKIIRVGVEDLTNNNVKYLEYLRDIYLSKFPSELNF